MYEIKVYYHTGDTFKSYDTDTTLGGEWNLETAKENLKRIKKHYEYYSNLRNYVSIGKSETQLLEDLKNEEFYVSDKYHGPSWNWTINLLENDGSKREYNVAWCGYFERLLGAEIISKVPEEDQMRFVV